MLLYVIKNTKNVQKAANYAHFRKPLDINSKNLYYFIKNINKIIIKLLNYIIKLIKMTHMILIVVLQLM